MYLRKYGRLTDSQEFTDFQIHTYTDLSLDRPSTIYDFLELMSVHYDNGMSLLGFALGQGPEQLSARIGSNVKTDPHLWIAFRWLTAPALETIYSISLRLHDSEGRAVYQHDAILENAEPLTTNYWQANEPTDTLHLLELPADFLPGEYELRLVVYDFATQKPTVELGVWELEKMLTSLKISSIQRGNGTPRLGFSPKERHMQATFHYEKLIENKDWRPMYWALDLENWSNVQG